MPRRKPRLDAFLRQIKRQLRLKPRLGDVTLGAQRQRIQPTPAREAEPQGCGGQVRPLHPQAPEQEAGGTLRLQRHLAEPGRRAQARNRAGQHEVQPQMPPSKPPQHQAATLHGAIQCQALPHIAPQHQQPEAQPPLQIRLAHRLAQGGAELRRRQRQLECVELQAEGEVRARARAPDEATRGARRTQPRRHLRDRDGPPLPGEAQLAVRRAGRRRLPQALRLQPLGRPFGIPAQPQFQARRFATAGQLHRRAARHAGTDAPQGQTLILQGGGGAQVVQVPRAEPRRLGRKVQRHRHRLGTRPAQCRQPGLKVKVRCRQRQLEARLRHQAQHGAAAYRVRAKGEFQLVSDHKLGAGGKVGGGAEGAGGCGNEGREVRPRRLQPAGETALGQQHATRAQAGPGG